MNKSPNLVARTLAFVVILTGGLCLSGFLSSCADKAPEISEISGPVEVFVDSTSEEGTFTVYFDPKHADNKLGQSGPFEVSVFFVTAQGERRIKSAMQMDARGKLHRASVTPPPATIAIQGRVQVAGMEMNSMNFTTILADDDKPVKQALPFQMAQDFQQAELDDLFAQDAALYPHEFERWSPLVLAIAEPGSERGGLDSVLQSIEAQYTEQESSLENDQKFDAMAALAGAHLFNRNWAGCLQKLDDLLLHCRSHRADYVRSRTFTSASLVFRMISFADFAYGQALDAHDTVAVELIDEVCDRMFKLGAIWPDGKLANEIYHTVKMGEHEEAAARLDQKLGNMYRELPPFLADLNDCDLVLDPQKILIYLSIANEFNYQADSAIVLRAVKVLEDAVFNASSPLYCQPSWFAEGQLRSIYVCAAQNYLASGNLDLAMRLGSSALRRPLEPMTRVSAGMAALVLAESHNASGAVDSAQTYCGIAAELMSNREKVETVYRQILDGRGADAAPVATLDELRDQFGAQFHEQGEKLSITLQTSAGPTITLANTSGRPVYLLFSSKTCGICHARFPGVVRAIRAADPDGMIVMLSDEPDDLVERQYGEFVRHVAMHPMLERQCGIRATPHVKVVVDGMVKESIGGLGPTSDSLFTVIAQRYSNPT